MILKCNEKSTGYKLRCFLGLLFFLILAVLLFFAVTAPDPTGPIQEKGHRNYNEETLFWLKIENSKYYVNYDTWNKNEVGKPFQK